MNENTCDRLVPLSEVPLVPNPHPMKVFKKFIRVANKKEIGYNYDIEFTRCNTPEKILGWIDHLSIKIWMTPEKMREFIRLATESNNIKIVYG